MRILFIGSIVGKVGKTVASNFIPTIKNVDFIIANGEEASDNGYGITPKDVDELLSIGINCITTGEGVWHNKEMIEFLKNKPPFLLRPLNYPPQVYGLGSCIYKVKNTNIGVINLMGRSFLANIDCPFRVGIEEISRLVGTKIIIIDFHAQTTAEKQAFSWYVDGKVSAVIGTHTKVQTADEKILPNGTAFISDVGVCGAKNSICGMKKEPCIEYFLTGIPQKFVSADGEGELFGVILDIDENTGKANKIERIHYEPQDYTD